jgi:nitrate reductase gamma subunit
MSAVLTAWPFVIAAYAVAIGGTLALAGWALVALRRAEARADALDRDR